MQTPVRPALKHFPTSHNVRHDLVALYKFVLGEGGDYFYSMSMNSSGAATL